MPRGDGLSLAEAPILWSYAAIMTRFEYKFELGVGDLAAKDDRIRLEQSLNELGDQGWELVAVGPCGKEKFYLGYWFKRGIAPK